LLFNEEPLTDLYELFDGCVVKLMMGISGGGGGRGSKRDRDTAFDNNNSKKEEFLAAQLLKAEKALDKTVSNPFCAALMNQAREFKNNGPKTPVDFVSVFKMEELNDLSSFLETVDKNGGRAMLELLPKFIKETVELNNMIRDMNHTKIALEACWTLKYCEHFMTEAGTIMTNNLVKTVDKRIKELKKQHEENEKQVMNAQAVAQRAQEVAMHAIQDPATLAQILQANPHLMQALMQGGPHGGAPPANAGGDANMG
jgi:hypothetical protein